MGSRQYRRSSNGRFAGAGAGTRVTTGKAGGYANAAFRARTGAARARKARNAKYARVAGKAATALAAALLARQVLR